MRMLFHKYINFKFVLKITKVSVIILVCKLSVYSGQHLPALAVSCPAS